MATNLNTILNWFKTGLKPTQAQFWASWQSFWHKDDTIPQSSIFNLTNVLNSKADANQLNGHFTDQNAHAALLTGKENKSEKGTVNGYVPLDAAAKIAVQYLNIVNNLTAGGAENLLSAEQGKLLQGQINGINTLLVSDNVNLDTVQELVDAIETFQTSLSAILVNDLTTGGVTKALTAEMGKLLQDNKVDKVAGNRLITAAEIAKLAGLSSTLPTLQDILNVPGYAVTTLPITFQDSNIRISSTIWPERALFSAQMLEFISNADLGGIKAQLFKNGLYLNINNNAFYSFTQGEGLKYNSSFTTSVRIDLSGTYSGNRVLKPIDASGDIPVINTTAPASATAPGKVGEFRVTSDFLYVCISLNTWKRSPLLSW
ncbi:MAG TPA: hypothetical protein VF677_03450 [Flavobacterium sp.]|jgi:hypothetical protein